MLSEQIVNCRCIVFSIFIFTACSQTQSKDSPSSEREKVQEPRELESVSEIKSSSPIAERTPSSLLVVEENAGKSQWPPEGVQRTQEWPFFAWDRAQAFTFNLKPYGPRFSLHLWTSKGGLDTSSHKGPELTKEQAERAINYLKFTRGGLVVSNCPSPRHGIVFYSGQIAVGSISACFECGDIFIFPAYKQGKNWEENKSQQVGRDLKGYDRVFPEWMAFFEKELGLVTDWKQLGSSSLGRKLP